MAATLCTKLLPKQGWLPLTQCVRHGSKAVTRHKKPIHILRKKLLAVTQYIPPARAAPPGAYPSQPKQVQEEESGLVLLLKRDLKKLFQDHKMIAVVQNNGCKYDDILGLKHRLFKHGITVKFFPNKVMRLFLKDSIYSNMDPLFIGHTALVISKEPQVKTLLKALRSSQQMTLLGGCIDDTLLTPDGFVSYSKLPALTVVQGQLVSGLTLLTSHTSSLLQRHPAHLSALLQQYAKQQGAEGGAEAAAPPAPPAEEAT